MMKILYFLTLIVTTVVVVADAAQATATKCTVNDDNTFIGTDSSSSSSSSTITIVKVAFEYDLKVQRNTDMADVESKIAPAIKKAFVTTIAPKLIVACAAPTEAANKNTADTAYSDIIGIDTTPMDYIVTSEHGGCKENRCYTIHSIFTLHATSMKLTTILFQAAIYSEIKSGTFDPCIDVSCDDDPFTDESIRSTILSVSNFKAEQISAPSSVSLLSLSPTTTAPANNNNNNTESANGNIVQQLRKSATKLQEEKPTYFYAGIGGIVLVVILFLVCCCCCLCGGKKDYDDDYY